MTRADFERGPLVGPVAAFLSSVRRAPETIDLLLDLGPVDEMVPTAVSEFAADFLSAAPTPMKWRTMTMLGCAFPKSMGTTATDDHRFAARSEWMAWLDLWKRRKELVRLPRFGDCAIQHPSGVEGFDPRIHQVATAIRFACATDWLLIKGHSTDVTPAAEQFPELAKKLGQNGALSQHSRGASHCVGCDEIEQAAVDPGGVSTPESWRRIGTIHHVATVLEQLAALPAT